MTKQPTATMECESDGYVLFCHKLGMSIRGQTDKIRGVS